MTVDKQWRWLGIAAWALWAILAGLMYFVNHYMPHGPMYDTGDVVCKNDDQGPCSEVYAEDMRGLHIPEWAKFIRGSKFFIAWIGLGTVGLIISAIPKHRSPQEHRNRRPM
jgi:hypothetical protein